MKGWFFGGGQRENVGFKGNLGLQGRNNWFVSRESFTLRHFEVVQPCSPNSPPSSSDYSASLLLFTLIIDFQRHLVLFLTLRWSKVAPTSSSAQFYPRGVLYVLLTLAKASRRNGRYSHKSNLKLTLRKCDDDSISRGAVWMSKSVQTKLIIRIIILI